MHMERDQCLEATSIYKKKPKAIDESKGTGIFSWLHTIQMDLHEMQS